MTSAIIDDAQQTTATEREETLAAQLTLLQFKAERRERYLKRMEELVKLQRARIGDLEALVYASRRRTWARMTEDEREEFVEDLQGLGGTAVAKKWGLQVPYVFRLRQQLKKEGKL